MYSNWSYSLETPNLGQIRWFLEPCDLEIWRMTLKNNRAKLGVDLCDLDLWPLTLTFCMDITSDHGNKSWKFHDDTMMGTWWKRCDGGQTDRRTDWTSHIAAWSQLKSAWDKHRQNYIYKQWNSVNFSWCKIVEHGMPCLYVPGVCSHRQCAWIPSGDYA